MFIEHWVFPFWSELEFVKLVKGKSDHQYDFTLFANSDMNLQVASFNTTGILTLG